jgi:hypothetical protein
MSCDTIAGIGRLADSLFVEDVLAVYMLLLVFVLVKN